MKIILISNDTNLTGKITGSELLSEHKIEIYEGKNDPLDVMSFIIHSHPSVMILDDDFLKPLSGRIISSVKNVIPKVITIFITSDESHGLGREITPLGIQYYTLKPVDIIDLVEVINLFSRSKSNQGVN